MARPKSSNEIETAEFELEQARSRYLRSNGWEHTSDTPSCHWLWKKLTPKGETLLVDTAFAVSIQRGSCGIRGGEW